MEFQQWRDCGNGKELCQKLPIPISSQLACKPLSCHCHYSFPHLATTFNPFFSSYIPCIHHYTKPIIYHPCMTMHGHAWLHHVHSALMFVLCPPDSIPIHAHCHAHHLPFIFHPTHAHGTHAYPFLSLDLFIPIFYASCTSPSSQTGAAINSLRDTLNLSPRNKASKAVLE